MSKRAVKPADAAPDFEAAITELEDLIEKIESGQIGLEACLTHYERGMALIGRCRTILGAAQAKIDELKVAADGSLRSETTSSSSATPMEDDDPDSIFDADLADDES